MNSIQILFVLFILMSYIRLCADTPKVTNKNAPPATKRIDHVDRYHGVEVADPYRWLEADVRVSKEVREWVTAQNDFTRQFLDAIPARQKIEQRLTKLWNYPKYSTPSRRGGKYFFRKNDGLQNQAALYVANRFDGDAKVLLDPNTWSKDGTVALSAAVPSDDGKHLAYTISEAGSDWKKLRIVKIDTGEHLDEILNWIRWGGVEWDKDGTGFFYGRYPKPKENEKYQARAENQMIYHHRLGTAQTEDKLVYARPDQPAWAFGVDITEDGKFMVVSISKSTDDKNQVW